ncbi:MAG TPA: hypothetical protein VHA05_02045 [Candidatus Saccharimonadales bacterium]|nr:hypothetical protein [Candidatus Saccharimonadales bacterium]
MPDIQSSDDDSAPEPELTPEQEKEVDDLVDGGVYNAQTARAVVLGLFLRDR